MGRGIDSYFAKLEKSIPNVDEHSLIASSDLSKAYDTTGRHGITSYSEIVVDTWSDDEHTAKLSLGVNVSGVDRWLHVQ